MAEFSEIMKQWRRMCTYCTEKHGNCIDANCPLACNSTCGELSEATDQEIKEVEKAIMAWAAEHPEPVYPTWGEWLMDNNIIRVAHDDGAPRFERANGNVSYLNNIVVQTLKMWQPIPADIAQKLGIEPKEG